MLWMLGIILVILPQGAVLSLSLSLSADNLPMRLYRRTVNTVTYTKWMSDPMDILKIQTQKTQNVWLSQKFWGPKNKNSQVFYGCFNWTSWHNTKLGNFYFLGLRIFWDNQTFWVFRVWIFKTSRGSEFLVSKVWVFELSVFNTTPACLLQSRIARCSCCIGYY